MAAKLDKRAEYNRSVADLGRTASLLLQVVERGIADNPDHRERRGEVWLAGRWVVLELNGGLGVYFHRLSADVVSLDLAVDFEDPPDWFVGPTGTWFELMDLT
jgi:hypothetical protein